jgi:hypothetical protein
MTSRALHAEDDLREAIYVLLRSGHSMEAVIEALMSLKIEMVNALDWQKAVSDAMYNPT